MTIAAAQCPECPSDTAEVEYIQWDGFTLGVIFKCVVCNFEVVVWH